MTSQEYYENNESKWGDSQYITLEDIINNYMMSLNPDDYTANFQRYQILFQARKGLREFYYDVVREIRAIALDLSPTLQVTLPPDYVNYVRISWVDSNGVLYPMAVDNNMAIAEDYLQDSDYNLLFDDNGCVLKGDSKRIEGATPALNFEDDLFGGVYSYTFYETTFRPNANMSRVFINGKYKIDKQAGVIQFGSDTKGKTVVIEYISDGLYTGCEGQPEKKQRVHKFAETALIDYIYFNLIKNLRNVPANEKMRARKEYYNSRRLAKNRINTLRLDELRQLFKGESRWIK